MTRSSSMPDFRKLVLPLSSPPPPTAHDPVLEDMPPPPQGRQALRCAKPPPSIPFPAYSTRWETHTHDKTPRSWIWPGQGPTHRGCFLAVNGSPPRGTYQPQHYWTSLTNTRKVVLLGKAERYLATHPSSSGTHWFGCSGKEGSPPHHSREQNSRPGCASPHLGSRARDHVEMQPTTVRWEKRGKGCAAVCRRGCGGHH